MMASMEGLEACLRNNGLWENYERNRQLIDMRALPGRYAEAIGTAYLSMATVNSDMDGLLSVYVWPSVIAEKESCAATLDFLAFGESGEDAGRPEDTGISAAPGELSDDPAFFL